MIRKKAQILTSNIILACICSPIALANDPFAELDAATSSYKNGSAQWQQKRAKDSFDEMDAYDERNNRRQERRERPPQATSRPAQEVAPKPKGQPEIRHATKQQAPVKPAPVVATKSQNMINGGQTVRTRDFEFELKGCTKIDREISCDLFITSKNNDKKITLYNHTRLYDDIGNEYKPAAIHIANSNASRKLNKQLISDVKTKAKFIFRDVASDATTVTKLNINAHGNREHFSVVYRNFALASQ